MIKTTKITETPIKHKGNREEEEQEKNRQRQCLLQMYKELKEL